MPAARCCTARLGHCRGKYDMRPMMAEYPDGGAGQLEAARVSRAAARGIRWAAGCPTEKIHAKRHPNSMATLPRATSLRMTCTRARSRPAFTPVPRVKAGADGRTGALPGTPHDKAPDPELGHGVIDQRRYTSPEFMRLEWERLWTKVWLLGRPRARHAGSRRLHRHRDGCGIDHGRAPGRRRRSRLLQRLPASRQSAAALRPRLSGNIAKLQMPLSPLGIQFGRQLPPHSRTWIPSRRAPPPHGLTRDASARIGAASCGSP